MTELRLMAVHAHPDDEASKGAATMARYVDEGHRVLVVTLTGGERGDILNPALDLPDVRARIGDVRRDEMARAAEVPIIAGISGSMCLSADITVQITCTSFIKPFGNKGRMGRSIRREVSVSFSLGRASRLKKPPGILPTA